MKCSNCGKKVFAKETCSCGVKAPNPHGVGVGIGSVIFFAVTLISVMCLIFTLSLRTTVKKDILQTKLEEIDFAELNVGDQKLDEYIYKNYIDDDRITVENVDNVLADPFIKDFISEKLDECSDYVLGSGDMPKVTADEIIALIEDNEDLLYNEAGLRFLEADKEELRENLSALDNLNSDSWIVSASVRTMFSFPNVVFLLILLAAVFINWLIVYILNSRRVSKMLRKYSIAVLIPSVLILVLSLTAAPIMKVADVSAGYDILKGFNMSSDIKMPFVLWSSLLTAVGIVLLFVSVLIGDSGKRNTDNVVPSEQTALPQPTNDVLPPQTDIPQAQPMTPEETKPAVETPVSSDTQTAETARVTGKCPECGHQNRENASFCSKCGTKIK